MLRRSKTKSYLSAPLCVLIVSLCVSMFGSVFLNVHHIYSYALYGSSDMSFADNAKRISLIHRVIQNPESLRAMTIAEFDLLFRKSDMTRQEADVIARHYQSGTCAIDVYFSGQRDKPDYVEFRALTLNEDVQKRFQGDDNMNASCLKDVLQARGINTPEYYAAQPIPSWDSPYSS